MDSASQSKLQLAIFTMTTALGYFCFGVKGLIFLATFVVVFILIIPRYFTHSFDELPKHCGYLDVPLHFKPSAKNQNYKYSSVKDKILKQNNCPNCPNPDYYKFNKHNIKIPCRNSFLAADLYIPLANTSNPFKSKASKTSNECNKRPIIIICHGIGGCRDMSLWRYAMILCSQFGYCVLDFDYLTFGESGGLPRQRISPSLHCKDIIACIDYIASEFGPNCASNQSYVNYIDADNIILLGMSYGGGHVLSTAENYLSSNGSISTFKARHFRNQKHVRCLLVQVPYIGAIPSNFVTKYKKLHESNRMLKKTIKGSKQTDGEEAEMGSIVEKEDNSEVKKRTFAQLFYGIYGALADQIGGILASGIGLNYARYGMIYGSSKKGELALNYYETFGGSDEEFKESRIKTFRGDMRNAFLLRGLFDMIGYNPSKWFKKINLPVLFVYSEKDDLCPPYKVGYALDQVKSKEKCETFIMNCDHFESATWDWVEKIAPMYDKFIQKHIV